jgi:CheY-like chemotaxis protein
VQDDGCGIDARLLPHVFELFRQGEEGLDRASGGLGIGLTLVQQLAVLHGGSVQAASGGSGQGATFTLRLPAANPAPDRSGLAPGRPAPALAHSRVLVVDDDSAVAASTALWLEMEGFEVRVAHSGPSAIAEAAAFLPHAVLLDIGLAGMDGYEVARQLRARPEGNATFLVAVTGYGDDDAVARARAAGFDHHVVKPFDPQNLLALLHAGACR